MNHERQKRNCLPRVRLPHPGRPADPTPSVRAAALDSCRLPDARAAPVTAGAAAWLRMARWTLGEAFAETPGANYKRAGDVKNRLV